MPDTPDIPGVPPNVEKLLARKVGPMPLGVWLALGVGVVAVAAMIRRRRGVADVEGDMTDAEDVPPASSAVTIPTYFTAAGSATGTSAGTGIGSMPNIDAAPTVTTNYDWRQRAEAWAIGRGFQPTTVAEAIARYLSGETLTAQQRSIIDVVLQHVGPTPEPVPPPITTPDPTGNSSGGTVPPSTVTKVTEWQSSMAWTITKKDGSKVKNVSVSPWYPDPGGKTAASSYQATLREQLKAAYKPPTYQGVSFGAPIYTSRIVTK